MARRQQNELVAGIFVIVSMVVLVGVIVWLGGSSIFTPAKQTAVFYRDELAGSCGLAVGSFVKIGDDQVGQISVIRFQPDHSRTFYFAEIDRGDFQVYADGAARVAAALVGGAELVITSRGGEGEIPADEANPIRISGGLDQAMADLSSAAEKISQVVRDELSSDEPKALLSKVHRVMESLDSASTDIAEIAANIKAETDAEAETALLAKVHASMDNVKAITDDAGPKVSKTLSAVRDVAEKVRTYVDDDVADILAKLRQANTEILKITKDFSAVSGEAREIVLLNRENIDEMLDNMVHVSTNLKAASKEIRRNPWRLLHKPDEREMHSQNIYDAARSFANGAEQLDQAIAKLTSLTKASQQAIPPDDPTLIRVRDHLTETFDKFGKAEQALWKELNR